MNKYGGLDDLKGEAAFIEQFAQVLSTLTLLIESCDERLEDSVIMPEEKFRIIKEELDRACGLFRMRRDDVIAEKDTMDVFLTGVLNSLPTRRAP